MPIEFYSPISGGAISTIIMETATELIKLGHRVTVVTKAATSEQLYDVGEVRQFRPADIATLSLFERAYCKFQRKIEKWDWPYYGPYLKAVRDTLQQVDDVDVAIIFNDLTSPPLLKRFFQPKTKICVWLQNEQGTNNPKVSEVWKSVWRVFTCSDYIADWTAKKYGIERSFVTTAISGVNQETFRPRVNYLATPTTINALYAGRIDPNKGPDVALEACRYVQEKGIAIQFTIAGDVWFYPRKEDAGNAYQARLINDMARLNNANWLGHVPRAGMPNVFAQADIAFTLSRSNEPLGLVALEAMASGCAVISSNRGGLPEACGNAAVLLDPDDQNSVNQALYRICTEPTLLTKLKQQSLARAKNASWKATAETIAGNCLA